MKIKKIFIVIIALYLINKIFFEMNIFDSWSKDNSTKQLTYDKSQIEMKSFKKENENQVCQLNYGANNDLQITFELSIIDKSNINSTKEYKGIATNPDPEGMNSLDFFDLSGDNNPMEMYVYKSDKLKILILLPLVELEHEYVVINFSDSKNNIEFNEMLFQI